MPVAESVGTEAPDSMDAAVTMELYARFLRSRTRKRVNAAEPIAPQRFAYEGSPRTHSQ